MIRTLTLASLVLLSACDQPNQPIAPAANDAAQAPAPAARPAVPSLDGDWRVTAITGTPAAGAISVAIGDGRARLSIDCLRRAWTYTQDRNTVDFEPAPRTGDCARMPSAQEDLAFVALGDANLAIFGKDGAEVTLSGTGGTLTLERR